MDEMSQESSDPEGLTFSRLGKNRSEPCHMHQLQLVLKIINKKKHTDISYSSYRLGFMSPPQS